MASMNNAADQGREPGHVVLLGDSIFDNGAYVSGGPDVVTQLRQELPGWTCSLLAIDGDVTTGVARQLGRLPEDASHLVVSVGGNDALGYVPLLQEQSASVAGALLLLAEARDRFDADYRAMLAAVLALGLPTALCTIYDTPSSEPNQKVIKAALALFNDSITRAAFSQGTALVDLRLICSQDADYANPIEPSAKGGRKIARAIAALVRLAHPGPHSVVVAQ
ncbi:GDSL-like Lipase/Acylhydrolase family protein [Pseudarthrobacter siccitolerans]|uniref:GDSL-like Lipase/Acylhydrolase family protein n=1 Tax=Pseudarthrobacter siccitolerans TaxID=861266 RepID=A0A024H3I1_9MICC|nr:SGNH/GDSL hydrolase family protein [Pseudarthrobacter siccitolerans]CCQ46329.1 GDSL-like Lipase/Acylhydrolase family protein [Pseudarthrobacter siccitolerans]